MSSRRHPKKSANNKGGQFAPNPQPIQAAASPLSLCDSSPSGAKVPAFHKKLRENIINDITDIEERRKIHEAYHEKLGARIAAWEQGKKPKEDEHVEDWGDSVDCFLWYRDEADKFRYVAPRGAVRGLESYCLKHLDDGPKERIIREVLSLRGNVGRGVVEGP